jgi:hypothetical protein
MNRFLNLIIVLVSITLIAIELVWTRIFSAEFFYTFAFLVLSLAVFGLGLGALALRLFKFLDRDHLLGIFLTLTGLSTALGPILVFQLGMDFSKLFGSFPMVIRFGLTTVLLSSAFFYGGIVLAMIFKRCSCHFPDEQLRYTGGGHPQRHTCPDRRNPRLPTMDESHPRDIDCCRLDTLSLCRFNASYGTGRTGAGDVSPLGCHVGH